MDRIKIDFLRAKYDLANTKERGVFLFTRIFLVAFVVTAMTGLVFSWGSVNSEGGALGFISSFARLVGSGDKQLQGEEEDRINVLFLGVGGAGHDGAELADTIIFSSFRPSTSDIGMLSLPRDLVVPIPGYEGWRKINSVNAYGESAKKGNGPVLASNVIGDVLDQPVQYYVKVDFGGFEKFIDELGGVQVYVDRSFTDASYPILGMEDATCGSTITKNDDGSEVSAPSYACRFEVLHFEEGWTHMDGATALKYARSRKGDNGEGNDFARAARQQKILLAVKSTLLSSATLLNPARISKLFDAAKDSIVTNMAPWEMIRFASFLPQIDDSAITHHVLNDPTLVSEQYVNGAYVLLPANNDWHGVQMLAANMLNPSTSNLTLDAPTEHVPEFTAVEVQNGTNISGLAFSASQLLTQNGFDVQNVGNAKTRDYRHTVIYDLTNGQKPDQLTALRDLLSADVSMTAAGWIYTNEIIPTDLSVSSPEVASTSSDTKVDFLIILGENTANLVMR